MVTVKVVYRDDGKPVKNKKVALGFDSWARGITEDVWTDEAGEAHFDADPGDGKVYIDGDTVYNGDLRGRVVVYI
ncbi:hypothetical protein QT970_13835 [Microcoleus sp. herbarium8]|uniref:hypothetical protein n=1 Tax=Microcoleus sp. herbarium8 TaxID=3055436 RepID=UPI002FD6AA2D